MHAFLPRLQREYRICNGRAQPEHHRRSRNILPTGPAWHPRKWRPGFYAGLCRNRGLQRQPASTKITLAASPSAAAAVAAILHPTVSKYELGRKRRQLAVLLGGLSRRLPRLQAVSRRLPRISIALLAFVLTLLLPRLVVATAVATGLYYATRPAAYRLGQAVSGASSDGSVDLQSKNTAENGWATEAGEISLLNAAVRELWPEMTKFVQRIIKESVEDSILESVPWFFRGLGFGKLSFGETALELEEVSVQGINQVCWSTGPVRDLKVTALVNWDAEVDVMWKGNNLNLVLEQVAIKGRLVIYLKQILPRPPFFTGMRIYFADPAPDVALRLSFEVAGQSLSPMWLEERISRAIQDALVSQLMLPSIARILLDINDDEAWFQVGRVLPDGVVQIELQQATGLAARDYPLLPFFPETPSSDPYCKLSVGSQCWRSPTKPRTLNPDWLPQEGTHRFLVHSLEDQLLAVQLFDEDRFKDDDFLGAASVSLQDLVTQGDVQIELCGEGAQGSVQLRAKYVPLVLDELVARQSMVRKTAAFSGKLDRCFLERPAFVMFVGVDSCLLPEPTEEALTAGKYLCELRCEGAKQVLKSRANRARGEYGASWGDAASSSEEASAEIAQREVNFQATFTHFLEGSPDKVTLEVSVTYGLFRALGSAEVNVSRLLYAPMNSERIELILGKDSDSAPTLVLFTQLRVTDPASSLA